MINGIVVDNFDDVGRKVSAVTGRTGKKPDYIVIYEDMVGELESSGLKVKWKSHRPLKVNGMSVVIVPR